MSDARFEDADDGPLRLEARSSDDLSVIAALAQDAVFPVGEMRFDRTARQFALLLNRFRWEDKPMAERAGRAYERIRSVLLIGDVTGLASQGIDRNERDFVLSLLDLRFEQKTDGAGELLLTLAGDGAIRAEVECLNVILQDVTRPYRAPSGKAPTHPE